MNENCLAGYRCPQCGSEGPFDIESEDMLEWADDGVAYTYEPGFKEGGTWACRCPKNGPYKKDFIGKEEDFKDGFFKWLAKRVHKGKIPSLIGMVQDIKAAEVQRLHSQGVEAMLDCVIGDSDPITGVDKLEGAGILLPEGEDIRIRTMYTEWKEKPLPSDLVEIVIPDVSQDDLYKYLIMAIDLIDLHSDTLLSSRLGLNGEELDRLYIQAKRILNGADNV